MKPLPATDLRSNTLTLAVSNDGLPRVACFMTAMLQPETYDPDFAGQALQTVYFDTLGQDLRKARLKKHRYCTVRIRCYPGEFYALSVKSESGKFREQLEPAAAEALTRAGSPATALVKLLPADLLARLLELTRGEPLYPTARLGCTRYAVEDATERLTLDIAITTNTGKVFPANILEHKTNRVPAVPLPELLELGFPPVKLSKFLWATTYGVR